MFRPTPPRTVFAFVLCLGLCLGALPAWAAPQTAPAGGTLAGLWTFLVSLFGKEGCIIDPYGGCGSGQAGADVDRGCGLDPYGRCAATPRPEVAEEGCGIDPNGGCGRNLSTASGDRGCMLDPHGGCER